MKRVRLAAMGIAVTALVISSAVAQTPDHTTQLTETGACVGCDLTGVQLVGANLIGVDLTDANLAGADLRDADLTDAKLINADLTGANLIGATLLRTDLSGAILDEVSVSVRELWQAIICFTWLPNGQLYLLQQNCP